MHNTIDNKDLWNLQELVNEYNNYQPKLTMPEYNLVKKAKSKIPCINNILCVGCGTGREVLPLHKNFINATIYANDISEKMLNRAVANFKQWEIEEYIKLLPGSIESIDLNKVVFKLITCFNNVFSYLLHEKDRELVFKKLYHAGEVGGIIIGMVHHVKGTPQKSVYFILRRLLTFYLKDNWNNKQVGRSNQKYMTHFYTKSELHNLLSNAGYKRIEIISLNELYRMHNRKYNWLSGSNNIIFFAMKE